MDIKTTITGTKAEDRMVITLTALEVDAFEIALRAGVYGLKKSNSNDLKKFEDIVTGSEKSDKAFNSLMNYLVYQSIVETALDCIDDFQKREATNGR